MTQKMYNQMANPQHSLLNITSQITTDCKILMTVNYPHIQWWGQILELPHFKVNKIS